MTALGPITEARIAAAFADCCVLTAEKTAELIGLDVRTLREMTDASIIRAVRRGAGKTRAYTEGDIRAYLTESAAPCRSTKRPRAPTGSTTSRSNVVGFTARLASEANAPRKR
jgi:hypothetical protein